MGGGSYSSVRRSVRAASEGYHTKTREQLFTNRSTPADMNPYDLTFRESRDSEEHPLSVPIIINLDVTGSMGNVPHQLLQKGLPTIVDTIIKQGIKDPQILFTAIGDHEEDDSPFQIGQFESSDELLDHWLTEVYLEGGGGGNAGESYLLAWYAAANHTEHDHWDKRQKKGYLFTIGDEPTLKNIPGSSLTKLFGGQAADKVTWSDALAKAREHYHVKHIHISETGAGHRRSTVDGWRQILGDDLITVQSHTQVPEIIAGIVVDLEQTQTAAPTPEATAPPAQDEGTSQITL